MKILFLALEPVARWGGSEELWAETASAALKQGHHVWITPRVDPYGESSSLTELRRLGARLVPRRSWQSGDGSIAAEAVPATVYTLARQVDVVFVSVGGSVRGLMDDPVVELIETCPTPIVATIQLTQEYDVLSDETRDLARKVLNKIGLLIAPADRSLKVIERLVAQPQRRTAVVPSPIRSDLTGPIPWPRLAAPTFACVGRLNPLQKGQDLLLEVLGEPCWKKRDWALNIVGRGLGDRYLEELALHYGLHERVALVGFQSDMADVWSRNHLLVMPSREESMPIAIMEAMFCARPSIVTDVGDNAVMIEHGVNGYVAEGDRPRALAAALEDAWNDRDNWEAVGRRAHETFAARRDPQPGRTTLALLGALVEDYSEAAERLGR